MNVSNTHAMVISNTESIPGKTIVEFYGVVSGNTVRAKHVGRDIMAGLKNIVGGELKGYTELLQDSRAESTCALQPVQYRRVPPSCLHTVRRCGWPDHGLHL